MQTSINLQGPFTYSIVPLIIVITLVVRTDIISDKRIEGKLSILHKNKKEKKLRRNEKWKELF